MTWRVAYSLEKLLTQLNAMAPWRSKLSDGGIGDAVHATRASDHNPWFVLKGQPLVTARDFTHDPASGLDCHWLAETLVASRDPRIKYIIWNGKILDTRPRNNPWKWVRYTGSNPHTKHLHLSVMDNASADDSRMWALTPHLPLDDDMQLSDKLRRDWDGLEITVKTALLEMWQNAMDAVLEVRKVRDELGALRTEVAELKARGE